MIQDPYPNTYGHSFSIKDDPNIDAALNVAIGSYAACWGIKPVNLFVHPCSVTHSQRPGDCYC